MTILFIDDEPIRALPLIRRGHTVYLCEHPKYVMTYLAECQIDLVCLDHDMNFVNGEDMAKSFLIERGIPVFIHSTNVPAAARVERLLEEYAVPVKRHEIVTPGWIEAVEGWWPGCNTAMVEREGKP